MHPYAVNVPVPVATRPEAAPRSSSPLPVRAGRGRAGPQTRETHLLLGPVKTAPMCARGLLRESLSRWGLAHLCDPGEEITTELVSNAIAASVQKAAHGGAPCPVAFWLTVQDGELCIWVWDPDPAPPPRDQQLPGDDAEHGRGLFIVAALSRRWGCCPGPQGGKYVWATLDAATRPAPGTAP